MYINCELKGATKNGDKCLSCHGSGCHRTDINTHLMIGRPNYGPHFHTAMFHSGDLGVYERYWSPSAVNMMCAKSKPDTDRQAVSRSTLHIIHPFPEADEIERTDPQSDSWLYHIPHLFKKVFTPGGGNRTHTSKTDRP